jgi:uncharacterized membrane protein YeaQ/YmgE (transglycosylase-associated protein family)
MFSFLYVLQSSDNTQSCISAAAAIVFGVIWGAVSSNIMKKKGRSSGAGWALGFFLGLIGVIICACLSTKVEAMPYGQPAMKYDEMRCPHCQNVIKIGAPVCQYCGKDPRYPPVATPPTQYPPVQ